MQDVPLSERLHLPQPSIDTVATQQMLDFFAHCLETRGPMVVDQLFHLVTATFPQEKWFSMFKTSNDLSTFFKLFANCFHIQSNLVTLLQKPVLSDLHIQREQARTKDCLNNNLTSIRTQSPVQKSTTVGDFKLNEPVSNVKPPATVNSIPNRDKSEPNSGFDSFVPDFDIKMENLCENNCPKITATIPMSSAPSSGPNSLTASPVTSPSPASASPIHSPVPPPSSLADRLNYAGNKNQSLKQRINNLVIKTLAENSEKNKHTNILQGSTTNNLSPVTNAVSTAASQTSATSSALEQSNTLFNGDTWKIKVLQQTRVIATVKESVFVTNAIMKPGANGDQVVVSIDCEGINLGLKGEVTLIEIGTVRGEAFIFDVQSCPEIITEGGLKTLLENDKVIKVIHDCRNDSVNLYAQFKILLRNVFDTQSAHALLQYQEQGKQVYKVKNVSLNTLCELYNAPKNPMKDQLKNIYRRDQKYWSRRPLSRDMLLYAAIDVLVLINEHLFAKMAE